MTLRRAAAAGDIYWIDPNPVAGRDMRDRHPFVVITPKDINALGVAMVVPVTSSGAFARGMGLTVPVSGQRISGVAVCNQVRSFNLAARERDGTARYAETLDQHIARQIITRVVSVIDPED